MEVVERVKDLADIEIVVPTDTAIQNERTSIIGDAFDRDEYHRISESEDIQLLVLNLKHCLEKVG